MTGHYLVRQARGPEWDASRGRREQPGWDEHAAFIDRLAAEGRVVLAGPVGEIDGQHAVVLVRAADEAQARNLFADDPWNDRVLRIESVEPWTLWIRPPGFPASGPAP
jgi:uncharacterized protein YciI